MPRVYVQSRGRSGAAGGEHQVHGYQWVAVGGERLLREEPAILRDRDMEQYVDPDPENISVVIARKAGQLALYLLWFPSSRVDHTGTRRIFNSVAMVSDRPLDDETFLRALAASALEREKRAELVRILDRCIATHPADPDRIGFNVDPALVRALTTVAGDARSGSGEPIPSVVEGSEVDLPGKWEALANELRTWTLPQRNGVLVVATSLKDAAELRNRGVWRACTAYDSKKKTKTRKTEAPARSGCLPGLALGLMVGVWLLTRE